MGGGDDWVFVLVRRTAEDRDKRGPKLAPILVVDVLGAAPRPPKLLRTSAATEFEVGLVQNIRGSPRLRAARFHCGHPGEISACNLLTVRDHAGARGC